MAKPFCERLNVRDAWYGPGGYGPPPLVPGPGPVLVLFPWYSGLCLILVRAKPLALSLYKGEALLFQVEQGKAVLGLYPGVRLKGL